MSAAILQSLAPALAAAGLLVEHIEPGSLVRCRVEGDRRGQTSGAYRLFDDGRAACPWWNWKAGTSGVWVADGPPLSDTERQQQRQRIAQAQRERQHEQTQQWARNLPGLIQQWNAAQPLTEHCAAGVYLVRRGLPVPTGDALPLRFLPELDYWDGGERIGAFPALLAAVTDPTGALVALHRTYLTADGCKAPVSMPKKLTRTAGPLAGASIKLHPPMLRDGVMVLGLAEGIETALAASALAGVPVWPCVSASGLASFEPPDGLQRIYVFADHDASGTGQRAAARLADRAARMGLEARTLTVAALLALDAGDSLTVSGSLTPKVWTDREGTARPALDVVAHQVLTAYHVSRKRNAMQQRQHEDGAGSPSAEDDFRGYTPGSTPARGNQAGNHPAADPPARVTPAVTPARYHGTQPKDAAWRAMAPAQQEPLDDGGPLPF